MFSSDRADDDEFVATVEGVAAALLHAGKTLATAESCTGGLIGKLLTDLPGSSDWYAGGVVSYSDEAKQRLLGVPAGLLTVHGAVSEPVACAMARGACEALGTEIAVAVTGIAGPGGGSDEKPVGTVWVAWARGGDTESICFQFSGNRDAVRRQAALEALRGLLAVARPPAGP